MQTRNFVIIPFIGCLENTKAAAWDFLQQTIPTTVLLIDNGSSLEEWEEIREWAEEATVHPPLASQGGQVICWRHNPPLPSLSATWNTALDFCWNSGAEVAMVCNNDIRVKPWTYQSLLTYRDLHTPILAEYRKPLFISAVGVTPEQYEASTQPEWLLESIGKLGSKGGPDFSCYLISKEGHRKYRFDENFTPAYCEDLDMHRRYMLGGDGSRIFSVALPYLHKDNGSGTLKSFSKERAEAFHQAVAAGSRRYYQEKWGGGANEEKFTYPFNQWPTVLGMSESEYNAYEEGLCGHVTTPQLQAHGCRGGRVD